ncbi:MAG: CapA family protein [Actinomycetota bacterium]
MGRLDGAGGTTVRGSLTVAAVGDCIASRPLLPFAASEPSFAQVVSLLRGSDATFGNLETSIVDLTDTESVPWGLPDDWAVRAQPETALDLRSLGVDLFARANNHATDWGPGGLVETGLWLEGAALVHAGAGETLAAARAPRYLETSAGRVGLVSMTTSPASGLAAALDGFGEVPARPGVNPVRVHTSVIVTQEVMRALVAIHAAHPEADVAWLAQDVDPEGDPPTVLELYGKRFELGPEMGVRHDADEEALAATLKAIRLAAQHADVVVAAAHSHQGDRHAAEPPAFLRSWAQAAIEHGADLVAVSGPHRLGPVELHRGRPILYGLGNFLWSDIQEPIQRYHYDESRDVLGKRFDDPGAVTDADLMGVLTEDAFGDEAVFRGALARMRFTPEGLEELRLHPVDLGRNEPLTRRGVPRAAAPDVATAILDEMATMSEPFGATVSIDEGMGVVRAV